MVGEDIAGKVADMLAVKSDRHADLEILKIDDDTWSILFDIDGRDFIATITDLPKQRKRETVQ